MVHATRAVVPLHVLHGSTHVVMLMVGTACALCRPCSKPPPSSTGAAMLTWWPLLLVLLQGCCPAPASVAGSTSVLGASLHPPASAHTYTELHIERSTVPVGTRWFCLRVNATMGSSISLPAPKALWFLASGSTVDHAAAQVAEGDQTLTFRPLQYSAPIKASRAQALVVLEAWSGRGGLPDSSSAALLLGTSSTMTFTFDDRGWSSSLKLVNFSIVELGPGRVTVSAKADNATAWQQARTVVWYGVVPTASYSGASTFTEDGLQSAVLHSVRDIEDGHPALNRSYSRPGVYYLECFGVWNGENDVSDFRSCPSV